MQLKSKVSLRQLDYFKAIGDAGSFRGAAERLGVTQPTLTAQIAALEESIGVKLLSAPALAQRSPLRRENSSQCVIEFKRKCRALWIRRTALAGVLQGPTVLA